jgi:hypothetical protein
MTRYLKRNDDGSIYVWTEALAKRSDMVECDGPTAPHAKKAAAAAPAPTTGGDSALDVYAITDKAELKRLLSEKGVKVAGNASLKKLQDSLAAALKGDAGAGD